MLSSKRIIYLCVFLVATAGFSILAGCGGDDSPATPAPKPPTLITMQLSAVIASVGDPQNLLGGDIQVGDTIIGTYTYNFDVEDDNDSETVGNYHNNSSPCGIFLGIGEYEFKTDLDDVDFILQLVNDHGANPKDNYLLRSYNNAQAAQDLWVDHISWQLDDDSATSLTSTEMTTEPPVLSGWTSIFGLTITGFQMSNSNNTFNIRAHVSAISKMD